RHIAAEGELYFSVTEEENPFIVKTTLGEIEVIGTEFNVKSRASALEVICYEGLVEVKKDQHKVRLKPNHIFRSYDKNYTVTRKDLDHGPHLTANESAFYSTPYREVIAEFERHYKVEISTQNIELAQEFTGRFPHDNKELALKAITVPLDISFSIKDENRVILSRND
ncbi:MAG: FecR family protein, partial [Fulvivirga sp.]|nr:FecR family protein [Fulvivirga sp.]